VLVAQFVWARSCLWAGVVCLLAAGPVLASGQLPVTPTEERLASYEDCLATLTRAHEQDAGRAEPLIQDDAGTSRLVELVSAGIENIGTEMARYEATVWFHNGQPTPDGEQREISHSYAHRLMECEGALLRTSGTDGYTSSTFEPITSDRAKN
jgi:hypothetical protein